MTRPDARGQGRSSLEDDGSDELGPREFEVFFKSEYANVVRILAFQGAGMADAQDAAQDAFLEVYRRWGSIQDPRSYLIKAAFNRYGKLAARHRRSIPYDRSDDAPPTLPGQSTDPSLSAHLIAVKQAVLDLPTIQREVMTLWTAGYTTAEIANILDLSQAAVRQRMHRARDALRKRLGNEMVS